CLKRMLHGFNQKLYETIFMMYVRMCICICVCLCDITLLHELDSSPSSFQVSVFASGCPSADQYICAFTSRCLWLRLCYVKTECNVMYFRFSACNIRCRSCYLCMKC